MCNPPYLQGVAPIVPNHLFWVRIAIPGPTHSADIHDIPRTRFEPNAILAQWVEIKFFSGIEYKHQRGVCPASRRVINRMIPIPGARR